MSNNGNDATTVEHSDANDFRQELVDATVMPTFVRPPIVNDLEEESEIANGTVEAKVKAPPRGAHLRLKRPRSPTPPPPDPVVVAAENFVGDDSYWRRNVPEGQAHLAMDTYEDAVKLIAQEAVANAANLERAKKPAHLSTAARRLLEFKIAERVSKGEIPAPPPQDAETRAELAQSNEMQYDSVRRKLQGDAAEDYSLQKDNEDLVKFWDMVKNNPADFTGWTYLLAFVEGLENAIAEVRRAFEAFLKLFPYCFGYWLRFAEIEKAYGNNQEALKVHEGSVETHPLCTQLWLSYINFASLMRDKEASAEEFTRRLYQKAADAVGIDYRSDDFWESYYVWEGARNPTYAMLVYDQVIRIPLEHSKRHVKNMKAFIDRYEPRQLITLDEFLEHHKTWAAQQTESILSGFQTFGEMPAANCNGDNKEEDEEDDAPPGLQPTKKTTMLSSIAKNWSIASLSIDAEEARAIRSLIVAKRERIVEQAQHERRLRKKFEKEIKRPYFHVKPLERGQLKNWKEYLDFEIHKGNVERIRVLFERCLVSCCLYEEFWLKYVHYLVRINDPGRARQLLEKACKIHLPRRPLIHMAWAAFEESQSSVSRAEAIFDMIEAKTPSLVVTTLRRANMYRRMGQFDKVEEFWIKAIERADVEARHSELIFYLTKYCRFLCRLAGKVDIAIQTLENYIKKYPSNTRLYMLLLDIHLQSMVGVDMDRVHQVFDEAIRHAETIEEKLLFSKRKMEFIEDFSESPFEYFLAYDDHQELLKEGRLIREQRDKRIKELCHATGAKVETFKEDESTAAMVATVSGKK